MKLTLSLALVAMFLSSNPSYASEQKALSREAILANVAVVNDAQNRVLMKGSTQADLDHLFSLKTEEFIYVHEKYGGTYTRAHLYSNYLKGIEKGRYTFGHNRYEVIHILTGENTAAIQRLQTNREGEHEVHLVVFEFQGDKVSRMVEYW